MGLAGIFLALGLLIWLAYRDWSVLLLAPAAALVAAAFAREPLLAHWTQTFMGSAARFLAQFFPINRGRFPRDFRPAVPSGSSKSVLVRSHTLPSAHAVAQNAGGDHRFISLSIRVVAVFVGTQATRPPHSPDSPSDSRPDFRYGLSICPRLLTGY